MQSKTSLKVDSPYNQLLIATHQFLKERVMINSKSKPIEFQKYLHNIHSENMIGVYIVLKDIFLSSLKPYIENDKRFKIEHFTNKGITTKFNLEGKEYFVQFMFVNNSWYESAKLFYSSVCCITYFNELASLNDVLFKPGGIYKINRSYKVTDKELPKELVKNKHITSSPEDMLICLGFSKEESEEYLKLLNHPENIKKRFVKEIRDRLKQEFKTNKQKINVNYSFIDSVFLALSNILITIKSKTNVFFKKGNS